MNDLISGGAILLLASKLLGKTQEVVADDLSKIYMAGRDKIIALASKKTKNLDDGYQANLRVTREVFWNGSFTDEAICAEYFGGVLAASRSEDGKDDAGVYYVDLIKSLSSSQLWLHFAIYRSLNLLLLADETKKDLNIGSQDSLNFIKVFFSVTELEGFLGEKLSLDLFALYHKGLFANFEAQHLRIEDSKSFSYLEVIPNSLGIQLYAIANNQLSSWGQYATKDFGSFDTIKIPRYADLGLNFLMKKMGVIVN